MSRFIILHGEACKSTVHWSIDVHGACTAERPEGQVARYRDAIEIRVSGPFSATTGMDDQRIAALEALLTEIRRRYPGIRLGAHSRIRGSRTTCPGEAFPLTRLADWWNGPMADAQNRFFDELVAGAYGMRP